MQKINTIGQGVLSTIVKKYDEVTANGPKQSIWQKRANTLMLQVQVYIIVALNRYGSSKIICLKVCKLQESRILEPSIQCGPCVDEDN